MQLVILPNKGKHDIIKHIKFVDGTKVLNSTMKSMCAGQPLEIDFHKWYHDGSLAFQYLLEGMGGFQVRYQKLIPAGASNKVPKETNDMRAAFEFIRASGPDDNAQVNDPNSLLHKWDWRVIKECLRNLADQGSQANTIKDWPLTLKSFAARALNNVIGLVLPYLKEHAVAWIGRSEVGKSKTSYTLSALISAYWLFQEDKLDQMPIFQTCNHLDYFRKEKGKRTKPMVFDD